MPGVFEHLPLLLKNGVFPSGLLVGVVNQYDLQSFLRSPFLTFYLQKRAAPQSAADPAGRFDRKRTRFRIAKKCYVGREGKSSEGRAIPLIKD
jgi:hypothetical protein